MNEIFEAMQKSKIIPVTTIENAGDAVHIADALLKGGIKTVEITYRTSAASKAISAVSAECPQILAGAGTVTEISQAREAVACGAKFIVSPGTNPEIIDFCTERGVAVIPGVATPTEIMRAIPMGIGTLKFFPAALFGGPEFMDAMRGPFPNVKFIPTGGITAENASSYLKKPNVAAVGGSWIVKKEFIAAQKWDIIAAEAEKALLMLRDN